MRGEMGSDSNAKAVIAERNRKKTDAKKRNQQVRALRLRAFRPDPSRVRDARVHPQVITGVTRQQTRAGSRGATANTNRSRAGGSGLETDQCEGLRALPLARPRLSAAATLLHILRRTVIR